MIRVALVGDYPLDASRIWGGVQSAFIYLVNGLRRIPNLDVHVVTLAPSASNGALRIEQEGLTIHLLPPFPRFELARNFRTYQARFDATLAELRPDVVHAQGATDHAYVALRSRYPAVITVHGVQSEDSKHQGALRLRARKWLYGLLIERRNLSRTRHLIAISRYVSDYFSRLLRRDIQVYYIPNAIDGSFFDVADASDGNTILFAGRVVTRKRPLDLVQAFARIAGRVPTAQLRLAGECHTEASYAESVRAFVQQTGLADRVHLLGGLSEEAVLREFGACDVLALPSAQETTPMVIAQAMAGGKPIVATRVGGVPGMVAHSQSGFLVDVGDVDGLADAMLRLLQDPALRRRMGQAARQTAVEEYHATSVARRTFDVYQKMVSGQPA